MMSLFPSKVALVAALFVHFVPLALRSPPWTPSTAWTLSTPAPAALGLVVAHIAGVPLAEAPDAPPTASAAPVEARPQSPFAALPEPPLAEELAFSGVVREVRPAGSYVYLAVENAAGASRWVATHAKAASPIGTEVDVRSFAARTDFASPRLGRSFDRLLFGIVTRRNVL